MDTAIKEIEEKEASPSESVETEELDIESEPFFQDIYMLTEHGVPLPDIEEMRNIGINTVKGLQMTTTDKLLALKSFNPSKKNSPYMDEVHRCVLLDQEVGLSKKADQNLIIPPDHEDAITSVNITFSHLKSLFLILLCGYHVSFVVFLCEFCVKAKNKF
ncbi:uncharacterized protein LOC103312232 isoform X2 [Tribolium castaneum]|uniref:uncharacterized protein LOC103312232 isoform X2 n=1 Tax=Tribolium castaneum TaxID=7070 RepID=UPI0030FF1308